jgi:uncharacterized membrane protein
MAGTVIAANVGGAVIPGLLSLYLLFKNEMWFSGLIATAIVTVIVHTLAYPVEGVGIAVPVFVPPVVTVLVALLIAREHAAAPPMSPAASARADEERHTRGLTHSVSRYGRPGIERIMLAVDGLGCRDLLS